MQDVHQELEGLRLALDQAAIVARTDLSGKITYVNDKFCAISGYERDELIGADHRIVNSGLHPRAFIEGLWGTIGRGEVWRGELRNRAKDGSCYWVDTTIVPLMDHSGQPREYIAIRFEVTDRKRAERQLSEQAGLARLGEMASVVAHEVRNPLAGIGGALQVIARRMPAEAPERIVIGDILERIDGLNEIVGDLLAFSRPRQPERRPVEMAPFLRSALNQVGTDPRFAGVTITCELEPAICLIDGKLVSGLLLNLVLNAAQATGPGGHILLSMRCEGEKCVIRVRDDGPGIPADIRDQIFEPFFTTRTRGTGLGLPTVSRVVRAHDGRVSVTCPASGGTVVTVEFPIHHG